MELHKSSAFRSPYFRLFLVEKRPDLLKHFSDYAINDSEEQSHLLAVGACLPRFKESLVDKVFRKQDHFEWYEEIGIWKEWRISTYLYWLSPDKIDLKALRQEYLDYDNNELTQEKIDKAKGLFKFHFEPCDSGPI